MSDRMSCLHESREHFLRHGWVITDTLGAEVVSALSDWVHEVSALDDGAVLQYREATEAGPKLCRSENFVGSHAGFRSLLRGEHMTAVASALLGEHALLYKEKINHKLAGGAGYAPHQDAHAYRFIDVHVSCMIAVDAADEENGCLEVVSQMHHELLPTDGDGCIPAAVVAGLEWVPVPLEAGSTLWFHSRTPHRSGPNRSTRDRRAIYPTYNAHRHGDLHDAYYERKRSEMAAADGPEGRVRVSLINDFQGRSVSPTV